ncbi:MAG TPA: hypothetical protein VMV12_02650 [Candidatus Micrarchaeaceae archaeon]|nr:hypothetical protein [Candidatus Micrarchaeaceae archaeon]
MVSAIAQPQPRHQLLTFASAWRRTQTMLFYGAAVMLIATVVGYLGDHQYNPSTVAMGVLLLLVGFAVHFGSGLHYVQVTDAGLRLNRWRTHDLIPFTAIRQVRSQPLEVLFAAPSRRKLLLRSLRQFERTPVCVIRLQADAAEVQRWGRGAGRGCAIDQDLILVVRDAKELERALLPRVPRRPPAPSSRRR